MSIYGEPDHQWRPRPTLWRLAAVSFCHFVLAAWLTNALLSSADLFLLQEAGVKGVWAIDLPPWSTLRTEAARSLLAPGQRVDMPVAAERVAESYAPILAGAALALALIVLYIWPGRQTLSSRLFAFALAQSLAAFGAASLYRASLSHVSKPLPYRFAAIAVAALICMAAEARANRLLANVLETDRPLRRVGYWLARLFPAMAAIAAAAWIAGDGAVAVAAGGLALCTLFINLAHRPPQKFENVDEPLLREAAAAMLFVVVPLLAAAVWAFHLTPPHRLLLIEGGQPKLVSWDAAAATLAKHWSSGTAAAPAPQPSPMPARRRKLRGGPVPQTP
jgi:hypothetical protein